MALTKHISKTALLLGVFAVVGTGLVALTYQSTQPLIAENERRAVLRNLNSLVPATQRDNDIFADKIMVSDLALLGSGNPQAIYRARRGGQPVAAVIETTAPDGYSGAIKLLVAIHYDGLIAGVRVISHRETPGLGDAIEAERSDWVMSFDGRSLSNPVRNGWRVKKDGGVFDQFTGATITPRAVVKSVHKSLQYFSANRDEIFSRESIRAEDGTGAEVK